MAIVALILWAVTACIGVSLLTAGNAARRRAASSVPAASRPARYAAVPLTADGKPPPGPRTKVAAPPGEHPFLQFSHLALAVVGLAFWFLFVFIHDRPLAWISFGVLVVNIGAGLSWLAVNTRATGRREDGGRTFPPRLIVLHGGAAAVAIALTVVTALVASHR